MFTADTLFELWQRWHKTSGWLSLIHEGHHLSGWEIEHLEYLDESYLDATGGSPERSYRPRDWVSDDFARECRRRFLAEQIGLLERELSDEYAIYARIEKGGESTDKLLTLQRIDDLRKRVSRHKAEIAFRDAGEEGITDEKIQAARQYPLEKVIARQGVPMDRHNKIPCPQPCHASDNPEKPRLLVKRGWGYCFSCQKTFNSIDFLIATENKTFKDAVEALQ